MFLQGGEGVKEIHHHSLTEERLFSCGFCINYEQSERNWHGSLQTRWRDIITIKNKIIKNKKRKMQTNENSMPLQLEKKNLTIG